jgi:hypothetical protein
MPCFADQSQRSANGSGMTQDDFGVDVDSTTKNKKSRMKKGRTAKMTEVLSRFFGAERGTRTPTPLLKAADFKSAASADSAIPAWKNTTLPFLVYSPASLAQKQCRMKARKLKPLPRWAGRHPSRLRGTGGARSSPPGGKRDGRRLTVVRVRYRTVRFWTEICTIPGRCWLRRPISVYFVSPLLLISSVDIRAVFLIAKLNFSVVLGYQFPYNTWS